MLGCDNRRGSGLSRGRLEDEMSETLSGVAEHDRRIAVLSDEAANAVSGWLTHHGFGKARIIPGPVCKTCGGAGRVPVENDDTIVERVQESERWGIRRVRKETHLERTVDAAVDAELGYPDEDVEMGLMSCPTCHGKPAPISIVRAEAVEGAAEAASAMADALDEKADSKTAWDRIVLAALPHLLGGGVEVAVAIVENVERIVTWGQIIRGRGDTIALLERRTG